MHKKCMVIDLDETLVHSSFKVSKMFERRNVKIDQKLIMHILAFLANSKC